MAEEELLNKLFQSEQYPLYLIIKLRAKLHHGRYKTTTQPLDLLQKARASISFPGFFLVYIGANCPKMAGTVPDLAPLSLVPY